MNDHNEKEDRVIQTFQPRQTDMEYHKRLKFDQNFSHCPIEEGDEIYPNGLLHFNITKILQYIESNHDNFKPELLAVQDLYQSHSSINEFHLESFDISRPLLMAEIAPGHHNVIDGHHRMEKARRMNVKTLPVIRLRVNQHVAFLTSRYAYEKYVGYWNDKVRQTVRIDPRIFALHSRTVLEKMDADTIVIVVDRKSRVAMADGRKLFDKAIKIKNVQPEVRVALTSSAPISRKTISFLKDKDVQVIPWENRCLPDCFT